VIVASLLQLETAPPPEKEVSTGSDIEISEVQLAKQLCSDIVVNAGNDMDVSDVQESKLFCTDMVVSAGSDMDVSDVQT
jgi:hypothetical protein